MKTKVFFLFLALTAIMSCGGDGDGQESASDQSITGHWIINKVKVDENWVSSSSANLSGELVISDAGYLKFRKSSWMKYERSQGALECRDKDRKSFATFRFMSFSGNEATVRYTVVESGVSRDLLLVRGSQDDILCKDPMELLGGVWSIQDEGMNGEVTFFRERVKINVNGETIYLDCSRDVDYRFERIYMSDKEKSIFQYINLNDFNTNRNELTIYRSDGDINGRVYHLARNK